ncbi:hypothetical protein NKJ90_06325 [Mesorhizobium sp. M0051]|uniref:hypothetical protein n=1 Tax=unclassified Mesorhizobium TaxID=325217 RepID=UPI0003CF7F4F|nr:hypothetical protein [Mesorhizobium sp. LNHC252B00]ESY69402.1 hypothetical protein X743_24125 [Mesorhizobium sp. LNHC252B00]
MLVSFERKEEDKSLRPAECKEAISLISPMADRRQFGPLSVLIIFGQADTGTENAATMAAAKNLVSAFKVLHMRPSLMA